MTEPDPKVEGALKQLEEALVRFRRADHHDDAGQVSMARSALNEARNRVRRLTGAPWFDEVAGWRTDLPEWIVTRDAEAEKRR